MLLLAVISITANSFAQNLFSYGAHKVSKEEFLYSYYKNNTESGAKPQALKDYLKLYVHFKLKVQAARDAKLDTLTSLKNELIAYKEQIAPLHMVDQKTITTLIAEAHQRAQKDLELQYIFIPYQRNTSKEIKQSTLEKNIQEANQKALNISARLAKGEEFGSIASSQSDAPDSKIKNRYLGYITVFSLPYEFENAVYALEENQVTQPLKNEDGIYLFKLLKKRQSVGKILAKQILISLPADAQQEIVSKRKLLADEIRKQLDEGISFDTLVKKYSDDKSSASNGGLLQEISLGTYEPSFENTLFALSKDGDVSQVCQTTFGFHIIKRISATPVENNYSKAYDALRDEVMQSDRKLVAQKVFEENALDFATKNKLNVTEKDLIRPNLELFSNDYKLQVNDFIDGNLLFEIMDRKVWSKSTNDLNGLKQFHATRKSQYIWQHSVYAWVITCSGKEIAEKIISEYQTSHSLSQIKETYGDVALIDSGRYEASELINVGIAHAQNGFISEVSINQVDGSATFVIVVKKYNDPTVKSFNEAKGAVINDYQKFLEDNWILQLKKKYPVVINQGLLDQLLKESN